MVRVSLILVILMGLLNMRCTEDADNEYTDAGIVVGECYSPDERHAFESLYTCKLDCCDEWGIEDPHNVNAANEGVGFNRCLLCCFLQYCFCVKDSVEFKTNNCPDIEPSIVEYEQKCL